MPRKKTGTPEDYTVEQMRVAILRANGLVTHAAKYLKCAPSTVYDYIKRHPEVKAALDEARSEMTDVAGWRCRNVAGGVLVSARASSIQRAPTRVPALLRP